MLPAAFEVSVAPPRHSIWVPAELHSGPAQPGMGLATPLPRHPIGPILTDLAILASGPGWPSGFRGIIPVVLRRLNSLSVIAVSSYQ